MIITENKDLLPAVSADKASGILHINIKWEEVLNIMHIRTGATGHVSQIIRNISVVKGKTSLTLYFQLDVSRST